MSVEIWSDIAESGGHIAQGNAGILDYCTRPIDYKATSKPTRATYTVSNVCLQLDDIINFDKLRKVS